MIARLVPSTAFSMSRNSDSPPVAPPLPIMASREAMGLITTWSPTLIPVTSAPTSTTSPAGS